MRFGTLSRLFPLLFVFVASASASTGTHVPGEILIKVRAVVADSDSALRGVLPADSIRELKAFGSEPGHFKIQLKEPAFESSALKLLSENPAVEIAQLNHIYKLSAVPNDARFSDLWGMSNTGQTDAWGEAGRIGADIGILPVWNAGITGSRGVLVAIIDTGVEATHPDLVANIFTNPGEIAGNRVDDDANGYVDDVHGWDTVGDTGDSGDVHGHGTHVAGTIGAQGSNGIGVAGVNWAVSLMPVRAFGPDGSGTDEATIKAIYYSIRMGARVINASWGDYDQAPLMKEAIRKAGEAGILFVAAAGNDAVNVDYEPFFPAGFPLENVVSVAAANRHDQEADFSNYGWRTVHVAAPGVEILSTYPGGTYGFSSGTSMAAPHVTGLAALLLSREPGLSPRQIRERLIRTSSRSRRYTRISVSGGRVHAGNLLADFVPLDPSPPESAWVSMPYSLETIHPYRNRTDQVFEIHVPGARFIRVVFDRFDLEGGWDAVTVSDDGEQGFDVLSGDFGELRTLHAEGERLKLRMKTDSTNTGWGFKVSRVEVIR